VGGICRANGCLRPTGTGSSLVQRGQPILWWSRIRARAVSRAAQDPPQPEADAPARHFCVRLTLRSRRDAGCAAPRDQYPRWHLDHDEMSSLLPPARAWVCHSWKPGTTSGCRRLYGVALGGILWRVHVFARTDAPRSPSWRSRTLRTWGFALIDCQVRRRTSPVSAPRDSARAVLAELAQALTQPGGRVAGATSGQQTIRNTVQRCHDHSPEQPICTCRCASVQLPGQSTEHILFVDPQRLLSEGEYAVRAPRLPRSGDSSTARTATAVRPACRYGCRCANSGRHAAASDRPAQCRP